MIRPPLWAVRADASTVYLYGQGPWGVREDEPWFDALAADAFGRSTEFWHEIPDDPRVTDRELLGRHGLEPSGLRSRLDDSLQSAFERAAAFVGIDPHSLEAFRPWLAAQILEGALKATADGPLVDGEGVLAARARAEGKRIGVEFVDAEAVFSMFATGDAAELEFLGWMADRVLAGASGMRRQAEAWLRGDVDAFDEEVRQTRERWPSFHAELLLRRNHEWLPRIERMLQAGEDSFIVMGMGHLAGDDGVLALARECGRHVDRVE